MSMPLVPCSRLEHGPTDHMVSTGGRLVDQELHLHVDPAVLALEPCDGRHVLQVGAIHFRAARRRPRGSLWFGFSLGLVHDRSPPSPTFADWFVFAGGDLSVGPCLRRRKRELRSRGSGLTTFAGTSEVGCP